MDRQIILIDGSSYFFRAYFAIQRLSTSKGFPTNAIYGFINMLAKVLEVDKPEYLAIVFDTAKPTFRKERYPEYKANRSAPPDDLVAQIPCILRAVDCFRVMRLEKAGFEADDIIGTVARRAEKEGFRVEIITGDKDLMQLVNDHISLFDPMKERRVDRAAVYEKFRVTPEQVVDLLALTGDSSDNVPGVTGIGEKTAADLIAQFGTLDGIYERLSEIKQEKRRETLKAERDIAYLSKELVTLDCNVSLSFTWEDFAYRGPDKGKLAAFFEEFEFQNLLKRFNLKAKESHFKPGMYRTLSTPEELKAILKNNDSYTLVSVDTETTSLVAHDADLVGVSLCWEEGLGFYIPVGHTLPGNPSERASDQMSLETAITLLKPILENSRVQKVGQNLKYDIQVLRHSGVKVQGIWADTLLASYLLDPDQPHNLDNLAFRHLGHQNITYQEVTGKGKDQVSFSEIAIDRATQYSGEDADVTLRLHHFFSPKLKEHQLQTLFKEVEVPLVEVLADMEYGGVLVERSVLEKMSTELAKDIELVEKDIHTLAGEFFNINSPKQLSKILFEKLNLPIIRKTKTGISTDEGVLSILGEKHEVAKYIVRYRELSKLKSTYVDGLLAVINGKTNRVHTSYNQTITATGRLSSSNPNLQNIPISKEEKYDVRRAFTCLPGYRLLSADYSQVELRILAHMSQDKALLTAFDQGDDVHSYTGRMIFGKDEISNEERKIAKTINFGVVYGQTPYGLSQQLKISTREAKEFIESYFRRYQGVRLFLDRLMAEAKEKGYVTTLLGRRRYFPEIRSQNRIQKEMAERAAINTPLQGTAADLIKKAMVSLFQKLNSLGMHSRMILQVHDELVLEVPEKEKEQVESLVRHEMESALSLSVPLLVDITWGSNWRECS